MTSAVDTGEMVVVHNDFRREFEEAPALIRSVGVGDRSHAEVLLWPKLRARIGTEQLPSIDLMEEHHAAIHVEVTQATAVLGRWRTFAHERDREPLADCFDRFSGPLDEHPDGGGGAGAVPGRALPDAGGVGPARHGGDGRRPARVLLPRMAARSYARYAPRLRG